MQLHIIVKIKKGIEKIIQLDNTTYIVYVHAVRQKGKANQAVLQALATYFSVPKESLQIIRGFTSSHKYIQFEP